MNWLPKLYTNAGGWDVVVGVSDSGDWYLKLDTPTLIGTGNTGMALLPLMEPGYGGELEYVKDMIKQMAATVDQLIDTSTFPYHAPVETALNDMPGWANFCIGWLSTIPLDYKKSIHYFDRAHEKELPQKVRQELKRHVNKWAKEHGFCIVKKAINT